MAHDASPPLAWFHGGIGRVYTPTLDIHESMPHGTHKWRHHTNRMGTKAQPPAEALTGQIWPLALALPQSHP